MLAANLVFLDMHEFDMILEMDWLAAYYASIDCHKKEVVFRLPGEQEYRYVGTCMHSSPQMLSTIQVRRLLLEGCQGYLAYVNEALEGELKLEDISIVRDFPEVFLEDLPRLPPDREVEFAIDLLPGMVPFSKMYLERFGVELVEGNHQALIVNLDDQGAKFNISNYGALRFRTRLCVPADSEITKIILEEAH
ncbi:uncharacterized protein LOC131166682 [Malania oleifera]|uniref:uncharacterized protein LOC131166682 n=1 Tax=Malania oleifera TaxID=397392 RepID=UPI0025AE3E7A|nr:uncharacterized protein LOC131166682 [Malania oleifera]